MCAYMSLLIHVCLLTGKREKKRKEGEGRDLRELGGRVIELTWLERRGDTVRKKKGTW